MTGKQIKQLRESLGETQPEFYCKRFGYANYQRGVEIEKAEKKNIPASLELKIMASKIKLKKVGQRS
jgi:hypothetical protein